VIIQWFREEISALGAPWLLTLPGVSDAQVQEAVDGV
jgi:hypothetical protein